jgi:NADH:ubiquinone oxidoreductase subunit 3 (subunit A)
VTRMLVGHATVLLFSLAGMALALLLIRGAGSGTARPLAGPRATVASQPGEGGEPLVGDHRPPFPFRPAAVTLVCLLLVTGVLLLVPWAVVTSRVLVRELQAADHSGGFALLGACAVLTLLTVGVIHGWQRGGLSPGQSPRERVGD